jgi:Tfp pilus assembly protein PilN
VTSIDLVPPEAIRRRDTRRRLHRWGSRLGTGLAVAIVVHVALVQLASGQKRELERLTRSYSHLQQQLQRAEGLLQQRENLGRHREAITLIRGDRSADRYLELLGATLTPDSYLDSLILDRCPPFEREARDPRKQQACEARLRIRGFAPGHEQVGHILRSLIARSEFRSVSLVSVTDPPRGDQSREVTFEILCVLAETQGIGG